MMPSHSAVRRPAVSPLMARITASLSRVGRTSTVTVSLNETSPTSTSSGTPFT